MTKKKQAQRSAKTQAQAAGKPYLTTIRVDEEVYEALKEIAKKHWITIAQAVGVALGMPPPSNPRGPDIRRYFGRLGEPPRE